MNLRGTIFLLTQFIFHMYFIFVNLFYSFFVQLGRGDIVRALLAAGADPGVQDSGGNTPLQLAPSSAITAIFTEELLRATAQSE